MVGRLMIWLKIPSFWQIDWLKVTEYHRYRLLDEICAWFQKSSVVITGAPEQESQASPRSYHNLTVKLNVNLSIVHSLGFLRRKQKCLNGKFVAFLENLGQTNLCFFNSCKERKKMWTSLKKFRSGALVIIIGYCMGCAQSATQLDGILSKIAILFSNDIQVHAFSQDIPVRIVKNY